MPVNPSCSLITHNNGVSGSTSTSYVLSFTFSVIIPNKILCLKIFRLNIYLIGAALKGYFYDKIKLFDFKMGYCIFDKMGGPRWETFAKSRGGSIELYISRFNFEPTDEWLSSCNNICLPVYKYWNDGRFKNLYPDTER